MKLTLVDRIFTRLGASDRLLEGKSTFFVEMEECKSIMEHATPRSLAILDELGRGTSTFDGYSLASAVMKHLTLKVRCRSMFSTHYHMLVKDFISHPKVQCYHMAFKQDKNKKEEITFLYKFIKGACPKSFGINVARMAGIPKSILKVAAEKSHGFAKKMDLLTKRINN